MDVNQQDAVNKGTSSYRSKHLMKERAASRKELVSFATKRMVLRRRDAAAGAMPQAGC